MNTLVNKTALLEALKYCKCLASVKATWEYSGLLFLKTINKKSLQLLVTHPDVTLNVTVDAPLCSVHDDGDTMVVPFNDFLLCVERTVADTVYLKDNSFKFEDLKARGLCVGHPALPLTMHENTARIVDVDKFEPMAEPLCTSGATLPVKTLFRMLGQTDFCVDTLISSPSREGLQYLCFEVHDRHARCIAADRHRLASAETTDCEGEIELLFPLGTSKLLKKIIVGSKTGRGGGKQEEIPKCARIGVGETGYVFDLGEGAKVKVKVYGRKPDEEPATTLHRATWVFFSNEWRFCFDGRKALMAALKNKNKGDAYHRITFRIERDLMRAFGGSEADAYVIPIQFDADCGMTRFEPFEIACDAKKLAEGLSVLKGDRVRFGLCGDMDPITVQAGDDDSRQFRYLLSALRK